VPIYRCTQYLPIYSVLQCVAVHCSTDVLKNFHGTGYRCFQNLPMYRCTRAVGRNNLQIHSRCSHQNVVQRFGTHCNTLQHTATHCNTCWVLHSRQNLYSTIQYNGCIRMKRYVMQHTATHCNTLQHQYRSTNYNTLQVYTKT